MKFDKTKAVDVEVAKVGAKYVAPNDKILKLLGRKKNKETGKLQVKALLDGKPEKDVRWVNVTEDKEMRLLMPIPEKKAEKKSVEKTSEKSVVKKTDQPVDKTRIKMKHGDKKYIKSNHSYKMTEGLKARLAREGAIIKKNNNCKTPADREKCIKELMAKYKIKKTYANWKISAYFVYKHRGLI